MTDEQFILTFSCLDRPGIVAAASAALFQAGGNILDSQQFDDRETGRFFGRIVFNLVVVGPTDQAISDRFSEAFAPFDMTWKLRPRSQRSRVLLLISRWDHCLVDLLYRWRAGELPMEVVGVVSNHPLEIHRQLDLSSVPFNHIPVTKETQGAQEAKLWHLVSEHRVDLVVLARYMQILSSDLSAKLSGRSINIHHSFLPGFKGARPYQQAHARGVKLIGATAHYVTQDLDEGPIIEQDVERITHRDSAEDLVRKGRDIERRVLARAVLAHLEDRVLLNGHKTVVFPE